MTEKPIKILVPLRKFAEGEAVVVERKLMRVRQILVHSSASSFGLYFVHATCGSNMILFNVWERYHELGVSYAALAASIIIYIDGYREHREAGK
jgi:hypothetical protein